MKVALLALCLPVFAAGVLSCATTRPAPTDPATEQKACGNAGGTWLLLPDSCVDRCTHGEVCSLAMTEGCDCGPGRCWDGKDCLDGNGVRDGN